MHTQDTGSTGYSDMLRGRLPSLTGLRWYAAVTIFLYHALSVPILFGPGVIPRPVQVFFNVGSNVSLSFFFVLSGAVLTFSVRPGNTKAQFWRRRVARIYPINIVATLLVIGFLAVTGLLSTAHHVTEALLLIQPWFLSLEAVGINPATWSLACEVFFYACFPLLLLLIRRIGRDRLAHWAAGVVAATFAVPFIAKALFADGPALPFLAVPEKQYLFVAWFPPSRMLEFVLGIIVARMVLTGKFANVPRWFAWSGLVVTGAISMALDPSPFTAVAVNVIPVALIILTTANADQRGRSAALGSRTMVRLGNLSLAFYVTHILVLMYLPMLFPGKMAWSLIELLGAIVLSFAIAFTISVILHVGVEQPLYRMITGRRKSSPPDSTTSHPEADLTPSTGARG